MNFLEGIKAPKILSLEELLSNLKRTEKGIKILNNDSCFRQRTYTFTINLDNNVLGIFCYFSHKNELQVLNSKFDDIKLFKKLNLTVEKDYDRLRDYLIKDLIPNQRLL